MQVLYPGQRLRHDQYGMGAVVESDLDRTSIDFDDHGAKLFVTNMLKAELIGEAPPQKAKTRRRRAPKVKVPTVVPAPTVAPALTKQRRTGKVGPTSRSSTNLQRHSPGRRRSSR